MGIQGNVQLTTPVLPPTDVRPYVKHRDQRPLHDITCAH
jgi:hypothetical protein